MFPANQNVSAAIVVLNQIIDTVRIVSVTRGIDCETKITREGLNSIQWTSARSAFGLSVLQFGSFVCKSIPWM